MSSDVLTVGSALRRAEIAGQIVDVLIEGQWMQGRVEKVEGDSAILVENGDEVVVRLSSVSAVRVRRTATTSEPPRPSTPMPAAQAVPTPAPTPAAAAVPTPAPAAAGGGTALDAVLAARPRG